MENTEQIAKKSHRGLIKKIYIALTAILIVLYIVPSPGQNLIENFSNQLSSIGSSSSNVQNNHSPFNYLYDSKSKACQITGLGTYSERKLTIPEKISNYAVTTIGNSAFRGQTLFTGLSVPGNVEIIGSYAFADCSNLSTVTLQYGVKQISEGAFNNCRSLSTISIPSTVSFIGPIAFDNCTALQNIYFDGTMEQWTYLSSGTVWNVNPYCMVYCADGTIAF